MKTSFLSNLCAQLRLCSHCRAFFAPCDPLCPTCWQYLLMFKNRQLKSSPIDTEYLFAWTQNEAHKLIKNLIYFLKYRRHTGAYQKLAQHFVPQNLPPQGAVFVPAPARLGQPANHALLWAQALAHNWQGEVLNTLQHKNQGHSSQGTQKQASRQKRRQIQFKCKQSIDANKHIVFCDDLVTTGSTAGAAWRALAKPKNFVTWSIAYRPLHNKPQD